MDGTVRPQDSHALRLRHLVHLSCTALLLGASAVRAADRPLEGFGADTPGGTGGDAYVVTTLADSGPGSLRDAVSQPNRYITFAVGGVIVQEQRLAISTHHLTIDGRSAPSPGITLAGIGIDIAESGGQVAHDVVIRNIRVVDGIDNLAIAQGAHDIVIDHCSFRRAADGNVDIFDGARDITLQYCIFADNVRNMLIRDDVTNVSLHHNLFVHGAERNPQVQASSLVIDLVNNVMFNWGSNYCSRFRDGATGNVVANAFVPGDASDPADALEIDDTAGAVYVADNAIPPVNDSGDASAAWPAVPVEVLSPEDAVSRVLAEAGAQPLDGDDMSYIAGVVGPTPVDVVTWGAVKSRFGVGAP